MADNWDAYIRNIQNGTTPAPAPAKPGSFIEQLFGALLNKKPAQGTAGPGQVPMPNKQGLYTPGIMMAAAGPSTPINYSAIRNMLNSDVLNTGKVPPAPAPEPEPVAPPAAAPAPKKSPLENLFSAIFSFGGLGG